MIFSIFFYINIILNSFRLKESRLALFSRFCRLTDGLLTSLFIPFRNDFDTNPTQALWSWLQATGSSDHFKHSAKEFSTKFMDFYGHTARFGRSDSVPRAISLRQTHKFS